MDRSKSNLGKQKRLPDPFGESRVRRSINVIARRARYKKDQFNSTALLTSCDCPSPFPASPPTQISSRPIQPLFEPTVEFIYAPTSLRLVRKRETKEKLFGRAERERERGTKERKVSPEGNKRATSCGSRFVRSSKRIARFIIHDFSPVSPVFLMKDKHNQSHRGRKREYYIGWPSVISRPSIPSLPHSCFRFIISRPSAIHITGHHPANYPFKRGRRIDRPSPPIRAPIFRGTKTIVVTLRRRVWGQGMMGQQPRASG